VRREVLFAHPCPIPFPAPRGPPQKEAVEMLQVYAEAEERFWRVITERALLGQEGDPFVWVAEDLERRAAGQRPDHFAPDNVLRLEEACGGRIPTEVTDALRAAAEAIDAWGEARRLLGPARTRVFLEALLGLEAFRPWCEEAEG
ncbi:MAG: hypothetical protein K6U88_10080, partial [Dehalococcoidia bacterium]|nr:hypothetical protein [Dehalococcoidia bacterium]